MRDGKELKPCLSGRGVTKVFGFGDAKTVAVDHVDFDFHEDVARADQRNGR